jgi:hypothetical protein
VDGLNAPPFGPAWQATLRRAAAKLERDEQLESDEVAALMLAAGAMVATGLVFTARLIKPLVDWCAAGEPATWFIQGGDEASPRQLN